MPLAFRTGSRFLASALLFALLITAQRAEAAEPALRVVNDAAGRPAAFEATGLPASRLASLKGLAADDEKFARLFAAYVVDPGAKAETPAMLGSYAIDGESLRFTPRFPLRLGTEYRVVLRPAETGAGEVTLTVRVPESTAERAQVKHIYPTANVLPENQLKFYLHFTRPMSRGEVYRRTRILDAAGKPLHIPFLELDEELWDETGTRLTLLIHPGRIKRGLKPIEESGPVLEADRKYTLVIDADWKDAEGRPMTKGYRKAFETAASVRTAVDTAQWKITAPRAGTKDTLVVRFPRALDHALLEWTLDVAGPKGTAPEGRIVVTDEERQWEFHPEQPWTAGSHQLVVETVLEDLAGNRVGRPFEIAPEDRGLKQQPKNVRIPFTVK